MSLLYPEISKGLSLFETTGTNLVQTKEIRAVISLTTVTPTCPSDRRDQTHATRIVSRWKSAQETTTINGNGLEPKTDEANEGSMVMAAVETVSAQARVEEGAWF